MPIDKKPGEKRTDFMSRCIAQEIRGGVEREQAIAICASKWDEATEAEQAESKKIGTEARKKAAQQGQALPDGSYPIRNKDELRRAIQSFGRSKPGDRAKVKRHIIKRARALNATDMLPEDW